MILTRGLILITAALSPCAGFADGASRPSPAAEPRKVPAVALVTVNADNFPFAVQSLFGRGDDTMVGLRDPATGKSFWVSPGEKAGGYTLESVDTAKGVAIFTRGKIRYAVRAALSTNTPAPAAAAKIDPAASMAREKQIMNDARMVSSALNQYCSEHAVSEAPIRELKKFFNDGKLSPDTQIAIGDGKTIDFNSAASDTLVIRLSDKFTLSGEGYDKSLSTNPRLLKGREAKDTPGGINGIEFSAATGSLP